METPQDDFTNRTAQGEAEIEVALGDDEIKDKYQEEGLITEKTYTQVLQAPIKSNFMSTSTYVVHVICSKSSHENVYMRIAM